jgi:hypothetical protein
VALFENGEYFKLGDKNYCVRHGWLITPKEARANIPSTLDEPAPVKGSSLEQIQFVAVGPLFYSRSHDRVKVNNELLQSGRPLIDRAKKVL